MPDQPQPQSLPPVGSVWRHNEMGEVRVVELIEDGVWWSSHPKYGTFCTSKNWLAWQADAARIDQPQPPPLTMEEAEFIESVLCGPADCNAAAEKCRDDVYGRVEELTDAGANVFAAERQARAEWLWDHLNERSKL